MHHPPTTRDRERGYSQPFWTAKDLRTSDRLTSAFCLIQPGELRLDFGGTDVCVMCGIRSPLVYSKKNQDSPSLQGKKSVFLTSGDIGAEKYWCSWLSRFQPVWYLDPGGGVFLGFRYFLAPLFPMENVSRKLRGVF